MFGAAIVGESHLTEKQRFAARPSRFAMAYRSRRGLAWATAVLQSFAIDCRCSTRRRAAGGNPSRLLTDRRSSRLAHSSFSATSRTPRAAEYNRVTPHRGHAKAESLRNHQAQRIEAGHLDPDVQRPSQPRCLRRQQQIDRTAGAQADKRLAQHVFEGDLLALGEPVLLADHQAEAVTPIRQRLDGVDMVEGREYADIRRILGDRPHRRRTVALFQHDADLRMRSGEASEILGQELGDRRDIGEDANLPPQPVSEIAQLEGDVVEEVQCPSGQAQQSQAGRGRLDSPRMPPQQRRSEMLLQIGHPSADGRRRNVLPLGGGSNRAQFDHGDEEPQGDGVEPHVKMRGPGTWSAIVRSYSTRACDGVWTSGPQMPGPSDVEPLAAEFAASQDPALHARLPHCP